MSLEKSLLTLNCFPSVAWFSVFVSSKEVLLERNETYQKQSFRNRYQILTSQGVKNLTVPVKRPYPNPMITDVLVDNSQRWQNTHWKTISTAYGKSPYFDYMEDELKPIFCTKWQTLFELNLEILTVCLKLMRLKKEIFFTETYQKSYGERLTDLRELFSEPNLKNTRKNFECVSYTQVFGNKFVENLSILDLILNEGRGSVQILERTALGM